MKRKAKTRRLIESSLGQHIALSVAAHLARTHLLPDSPRPYDGQHLSENVDVIARALVQVAPLYVLDAGVPERRQLTALELEGAVLKRAATSLVLRDGRTFSSVAMKRADLRQAISILKAIGISGLPTQPPKQAPAPKVEQPRRLTQFAELESLLRLPLIAPHIERAFALATTMARQADRGHVANRAMQLVSAVLEARDDEANAESLVSIALARLRAAIAESEKVY